MYLVKREEGRRKREEEEKGEGKGREHKGAMEEIERRVDIYNTISSKWQRLGDIHKHPEMLTHGNEAIRDIDISELNDDLMKIKETIA